MSTNAAYRAGLEQQFHNEWVTFFATFARFEHALKKAPYLKHTKSGTTAEAGWAGFANDLGPEFLDLCRTQPDLEKLRAHKLTFQNLMDALCVAATPAARKPSAWCRRNATTWGTASPSIGAICMRWGSRCMCMTQMPQFG